MQSTGFAASLKRKRRACRRQPCSSWRFDALDFHRHVDNWLYFLVGVLRIVRTHDNRAGGRFRGRLGWATWDHWNRR
jgi:hypothetical protein